MEMTVTIVPFLPVFVKWVLRDEQMSVMTRRLMWFRYMYTQIHFITF